MGILMRPKKENLLLSMSELAEADYGKKSAELEQMYRRLLTGRRQFEEVMEGVGQCFGRYRIDPQRF